MVLHTTIMVNSLLDLGLFDPIKAVNPSLGCVWESLSTTYLSLSFHINTFDKNCRYLEELIKIAYDSPISHF